MSQKRQRRAPWENDERHYCALCNSWMGSDRQSILIHEGGRKHREATEADLLRRREDRAERERADRDMAGMLKRIEASAASRIAGDVSKGFFASSQRPPPPLPSTTTTAAAAAAADTSRRPFPLPPPSGPAEKTGSVTVAPPPPPAAGGSGGEIGSWQARKRTREEARRRHPPGGGDSDDGSSADDERSPSRTAARKSAGGGQRGNCNKVYLLGEDEGHYSLGDVTYLEGRVYAPIVEPDVPVQIWTGPDSAGEAEKRSSHSRHFWKTGLAMRVSGPGGGDDGDGDCSSKEESGVKIDVAYLRDPGDEDETVERSVRSGRIRLVLGSDDTLPGTIEEARIDLAGGEEIVEASAGGGAAETDENTGLGSWGTVSVRRVTSTRDVKQERARHRASRREAAEREREKEREVLGRRMEEARVAGADDSALGSYDVWCGGRAGYKGVDIGAETKLAVSDTAKSLAGGSGGVKFKKVGEGGGGASSRFKKAKKKRNRRVTSADDD